MRVGPEHGSEEDMSGESAAAPGADTAWYQLDPDAVASRLEVDPSAGLTGAKAAELAKRYGPNALPAEKPKPYWRRFLDEYTSYLQIILVVAGIVSLVIREWSTGILLLILTVINAIVGLREAGKAESAMNALKSMM